MPKSIQNSSIFRTKFGAHFGKSCEGKMKPKSMNEPSKNLSEKWHQKTSQPANGRENTGRADPPWGGI